MAFAILLQQGGIQQVLVHRQQRFGLWSTDAFWMSLTLAVGAAVLVMCAAPIAARVYHEPRLIGLMAVMAAGLPLDGVSVVPIARLQVDLKFRTYAWVTFASAVSQVVMAIGLAGLGMGAYSIVVPKIPAGICAAIALWRLTKVRLRARPRLSRWRFLFADSLYMLGASLLYAFATQGAYFILGFHGQTDEVGRYWWAYALSVQTVMLISLQLDPVLFASLTKLQGEPRRHGHAYVRSLRVLALVVVPLSAFQAVLAEPGVKLVFAERWHAAIPVLQFLSVGMAFVGISIPSGSMMQSMGRFRAYFASAAANVTIFVLLMIPAAADGRARVIAMAAMVYYFFAFVINLVTALAPAHVEWRRVASPLAGILAAGLLAGAAGFGAQRMIAGPDDAVHLIERGVVGAIVLGVVYLGAIMVLQPATLKELVVLARASLSRPRAHHGS